MSEYTKSLPKNPINNLFSIFQYLNYINNYKSNVKLKYLLIIFLKFDLDLDLQSFFLYL